MGLTRRSLIATAAAAVGVLGIKRMSGASSDATAAAGTLSVMGNPYNELTYRRLAAEFDDESRASRTRISFSPREGDEIVRTLLLRTFTGARLPDVAFLNGDVIRTFVERRLLTPLDAMLAPFGDDTLRAVRVGAASYGVPFGVSVPVVAYNSALLQRVGVDSLPCDWPGVLALARAIRQRVPDVLGGFIEHDNGGAFTFLYLIGSFGLRPMSEDERRLAFASWRGVQALEVLKGFGEAGQAFGDMSRRQARRAFATGRIGVLVTMSSVLPYLERTNAGRFGLRAGPLPLAHPGAIVPAAGPVAVLFANTPAHEQEAWRFVRFAASDRGQCILAKTSGYLPAYESRKQPPARPLSSLVDPERLTSWYMFPGRNSLKIAELIQDEMQQVATLQKAPEDAMQSMVAAVEPLLAPRAQT